MRVLPFLLMAATAGTALFSAAFSQQQAVWTPKELLTMRGLSLDRLEAKPPGHGNRYLSDSGAIALGHQLFYDPRLSDNDENSCATCHQPSMHYVDHLARAEAKGRGTRKTPTIVGSAFNTWYFWDGRADSSWSQALGPIENGLELANTRMGAASLIVTKYRASYEAIFGKLPADGFWDDLPKAASPVGSPQQQQAWQRLAPEKRNVINRIFANVGKSLAAFQAQFRPAHSRFDDYLDAITQDKNEAPLGILTKEEIAGFKLFLGKARCVECHSGPRLTDNDFHNTGVPTPKDLQPDDGRAAALQQFGQSGFGCRSVYSDDISQCPEINDESRNQMLGAFRTPSLRNVPNHGPFMHSGQLRTLPEVVAHYNQAPTADMGLTQLQPLNLSSLEQRQLVAFLKTLATEKPDAPAPLLETPELPQ
jgi:cytochrome c peroxidase